MLCVLMIVKLKEHGYIGVFVQMRSKSLSQQIIAQPADVHYNRGVSSLKPLSGQLAKTLITVEPHGVFG